PRTHPETAPVGRKALPKTASADWLRYFVFGYSVRDAGFPKDARDATVPSLRFRLMPLSPALVSMSSRRRISLTSTGPESTRLRCRKRSAYAGTVSDAPNAPCVH